MWTSYCANRIQLPSGSLDHCRNMPPLSKTCVSMDGHKSQAVTRTSACRRTCIFAREQPSKRPLSDLDSFFWRRPPKFHARPLLERHTLAQDKRGSKARPEASSNSKECLTPTAVVKGRCQTWGASQTLLSKSRSQPEPPVKANDEGRSLLGHTLSPRTTFSHSHV